MKAKRDAGCWTCLAAGMAMLGLLFSLPVAHAQGRTLSISDATVTEGNAGPVIATFTVQVSTPSSCTISFRVTTADGSAQAGTDYVAQNMMATIAAGQSTRTITIQVNGDTAVEPDESFFVNLSEAVNATLADSQGVATILNDDGIPGELHHFAVATVPSPQNVGEPFNATVTALDYRNDPVADFNGTLNLHGISVTRPSDTILGETPAAGLGTGNYTLGYSFVPATDILVTHVRHYFGTKVSIWEDNGTLVFGQPVSSTPGIWQETPLPTPVVLDAGEEYWVGCYTGGAAFPYAGHTELGEWFPNGTFGDSGYGFGDTRPNNIDGTRWWYVDLRFTPVVDATVTPTTLTGFVNGVWTGPVTVTQPSDNLRLIVEGHALTTFSNPFAVELLNDVSVTISGPARADATEETTITVFVTASGPDNATGVELRVDSSGRFGPNPSIPPTAGVVSIHSTHGTPSDSLGFIQLDIGTLGAGETATLTIVFRFGQALFDVNAVVTALTGDVYPFNNSDTHGVFVISPILGRFNVTALGTGDPQSEDASSVVGNVPGGLAVGREEVLVTGSDGTGTFNLDDLLGGTAFNPSARYPWIVSDLRTGAIYTFAADGIPLQGNGTANSLVPIDENTGGVGGSVKRDIWRQETGIGIGDIPQGRPPDSTDWLVNLESLPGLGNQYGGRLSTILRAPETGDYTFWMASDDNGELWLSTDESPANKRRIASVGTWTDVREWDKEPGQKSAPIHLTAGAGYYVELLWKEGGGGDHASGGWAKPDESTAAPSEVVPFDSLSRVGGSDGSPPPVRLSQMIELGSGSGIFAGYGNIGVHNGLRVYTINVTDGQVTDHGAMPAPVHQNTSGGNYWGILEHEDTQFRIIYVKDSQTIARTSVPDGETTVVGNFNNLGTTAAISVVPWLNRWYFHYEGSSQFGNGIHILGSADATFDLILEPPNRPPTFVGGANVTVFQESGPYAAPWASAMGTGGEEGQTVTFVVETDRPDLFDGAVAIDPNGTLTFTPAPRKFGIATVTVRAVDNGGTANGGVDTSEAQAFTITILPGSNLEVYSTNWTPPDQSGSSFPFRTRLFNSGAAAAQDVVVTVEVPTGLTVVSTEADQGEQPAVANGTVTCNVGTLQPLEAANVTIVITPNGPGLYKMSSEVTTTTYDFDLSSNSSETTRRVGFPPAAAFGITGLTGENSIAFDVGPVTGGGDGALATDWERILVHGSEGAGSFTLNGSEGNPVASEHWLLVNNLQDGNDYAFTDHGSPLGLGESANTLTRIDLTTGKPFGKVEHESWFGVPGYRVNQIPFNEPPQDLTRLATPEIKPNTGDHYGTRLRFAFRASETGEYRFFIASDNKGELWISTDANPASKQLIASVPDWAANRQFDKFPEQGSASIFLSAGQVVYFEALQKEDRGGDVLSVGRTLPGQTTPEVIPESELVETDSLFQVPLSQTITLSGGSGIFSGFGRAVIHNDSGVFQVTLADGFVTTHPSTLIPERQVTAYDLFWGVAEHSSDGLNLVYFKDGQTVARTRVATGETEVVGTFTDLGDAAAITVDLQHNRWFGSYQGNGQFGNGVQVVWSADASFNFEAPLEVSIADTIAAESDSEMVFTLTLNRATDHDVLVEVTTRPGSATPEEDYINKVSTVLFHPGETTRPFRVLLVNDRVPETDEDVRVSLSNPRGAEIERGEAIGMITDDDAKANAQVGDSVATCGGTIVELTDIQQAAVEFFGENCQVGIKVCGSGSADFRIEPSNASSEWGPGDFNLDCRFDSSDLICASAMISDGSVVLGLGQGSGSLRFGLHGVAYELAVSAGGTVRISGLVDEAGALESIEITPGGPPGAVVLDGAALTPGLTIVIPGFGQGSHLSAGPDSLTRPNNTRIVKVPIPVLLANDVDEAGHPLQIRESTTPATPPGAMAQIAGNFFVYTAPSATAGDGSFSYVVSDGSFGHEAIGVVTVTEVAAPVSDPPPNNLAAARVGEDIVVTFIGVPGHRYRVQFATSGPPYTWQEFDPRAVLTAPDNGIITFTDVRPPDGMRLYRILSEAGSAL